MQLTLIKNTDETQIVPYKIARVIYAQTSCASLRLVEAMASMIHNASDAYGVSMIEIANNPNIFPVLHPTSPTHNLLAVDANNRGFQMCLRVVRRMLNGALPDMCRGAIRFHMSDEMPDWARARGYIADIDGFLFYQ